MEAVEAFCDHLEDCADKCIASNPSAELLEAMSMQLALVLHGSAPSDGVGPPVQLFSSSCEPNAFDPIEFGMSNGDGFNEAIKVVNKNDLEKYGNSCLMESDP